MESPSSAEELWQTADTLKLLGRPLMVLVEGGRTPYYRLLILPPRGYQVISYSGSMQKTAISAMQPLLRSLRETGSVAEIYPASMVSLDERGELLRLKEYADLDDRFSGDP